MDAITMLKDDHKTVERLFKRYEKAGDKAFAEKRKVAQQICTELSVHAAVEEQLFYPVIRATVDDVEDLTLESLEEHHIVKWVLSELDDRSRPTGGGCPRPGSPSTARVRTDNGLHARSA